MKKSQRFGIIFNFLCKVVQLGTNYPKNTIHSTLEIKCLVMYKANLFVRFVFLIKQMLRCLGLSHFF